MLSTPELSRLREIGFGQRDAADRLALCRAVTGAAIVRTLWHLPPGTFFAEHLELLERAKGRPNPRRAMPVPVYEALRSLATASAAAWAAGADHIAIRLCANVSFALLQKYVVDFHEDLWTYNSHLNAFLGLLSVVDAEADSELASAALTALQGYYASVYLQSGVSKLLVSGPGWLRGGTTRAAWGELGTPLGKKLATSDPRLAVAASAATVTFELAFVPVLLLAWRHRALLGAGSLLFHGAAKATLNISFWHLAWFAAPLFAAPEGLVTRAAALIRRRRRPARRGAPLLAAVAAAAAPHIVGLVKGRKVVSRTHR